MSIRRSRLLGWVLAAAACAACSPGKHDPPPDQVAVELALERRDPEVTIARTYAVVLHASPDVPVTIELDGAPAAQGRDGQLVRVTISQVANGPHALVAVAEAGGRRFESAPLVFQVDRSPPALVAWSPAAGVAWPPLEVTATFAEPVTLVTAEMLIGGEFAWAPDASISADGLTARVSLGWFAAGVVHVRLAVKDALGNVATHVFGGWTPGPLEVELAGVPPGGMVRGAFTVSVRWRGPERVHLSVGGYPATLEAPGGPDGWREGQAEVDTSALADGPVTVRVEAPGFQTWYAEWTVDHTPPALVSCATLEARADDAIAGASVVAKFSEAVTPVAAPGALADELVLQEAVREPLPYTWRGGTPEVRDAAGNVLGAQPCGDLHFPLWRAPAGAGPIPVNSFATAAAVRLFAVGENGIDLLVAERLEGQLRFERGGHLLLYPPPPAPIYGWSLDGSASVDSSAIDVEAAAWVVAVDFASSLTFRSHPYALEYHVGVTPAARFPQRALAAARGGGVAWTDGAAGDRALRASWRVRIGRATLDAGMEPAAEVEGAALAAGAPRLAWLERAPGGPALLRLREAAGSPLAFGPDLGPLNADPAASASEPSLLASPSLDAVAWVEGGKVLVRTRAPGGAAYGAPVVANADPARAARTPALALDADGPVLAFVEETPAGDRIEVRRFSGGAWVPAEGLDLGATGAEVSFAWPGVLWRAAGETRVRVNNR